MEEYEWKGELRGYPATAADIDNLIGIYDAYDGAFGVAGDALKGEHLDLALRNAVHAAYDFTQIGRKLAVVREVLMAGVEHCPICGISPPRQLDHYLPKSTFKPLAIYPRNLVPICGECNQSKSASASAAPGEQFIHAYYETLPDVTFLKALASTVNGLVVEFRVREDVGLSPLLFERLSFQLSRLHLNARYAKEINTYLTGHTTALHWCFQSGGGMSVRMFLAAQAAVEFDRFHRNHWRPILLQALAGHDAFCDGDFMLILPAAPMGAALQPAEVPEQV
ncbi:HNH endonuclease [Ensifer sp. NBAIM29]|nr:HNH endonuclease [Ensifer sp. NBAIM29]